MKKLKHTHRKSDDARKIPRGFTFSTKKPSFPVHYTHSKQSSKKY